MKKNILILCMLLSLFSCLAVEEPKGLSIVEEPKRQMGVSVQLYSVRNDMKKDFEGTLRKIKAMGFDGVEFAGYFAYAEKPEELKKLLDEIGLKAAATHIRSGNIMPNTIEKTIAFHKKIDCKLLIIPVHHLFARNVEQNKNLANIFNVASKTLEPHGLYCGYHNHKQEMARGPEAGKSWWDLFAENTGQRVVLQQDVGWTWVAGKDPVAFVKKYPGRTLTTHFKAKVVGGVKGKPFIGENGRDWKTLIKACYDVGGTQWLSIEQEDYPKGMTPLQCVERSYKNLDRILKEMDLRK